MIKVYLAGGMRTGWQQRLKEKLNPEDDREYFNFLDPVKNHSKNFEEFTVLDLHHVRQCDVVFGYLEESNPSGFGMAVEMGYAMGLGKTVIFVNETDDRYKKFIEKSANIVFTNFDEGVEFLSKLQG